MQHGTCPACRHAFLDVAPLSDSDTESEDGDYIPDDDDEMDTEDDFDFEPDWDMVDETDEEEVDADLLDQPHAELDNLGLSDGEGSDSPSEGDLAVSFDSESQSYVMDSASFHLHHRDPVFRLLIPLQMPRYIWGKTNNMYEARARALPAIVPSTEQSSKTSVL